MAVGHGVWLLGVLEVQGLVSGGEEAVHPASRLSWEMSPAKLHTCSFWQLEALAETSGKQWSWTISGKAVVWWVFSLSLLVGVAFILSLRNFLAKGSFSWNWEQRPGWSLWVLFLLVFYGRDVSNSSSSQPAFIVSTCFEWISDSNLLFDLLLSFKSISLDCLSPVLGLENSSNLVPKLAFEIFLSVIRVVWLAWSPLLCKNLIFGPKEKKLLCLTC